METEPEGLGYVVARMNAPGQLTIGNNRLNYRRICEDSRDPEKLITLNFHKTFDTLKESFERHPNNLRGLAFVVLEFVMACEMHELREHILYDGEILSDPHLYGGLRFDVEQGILDRG